MPNSKNAFRRWQILDQLLHERRGYSTQELLERVNHKLYAIGEEPVRSLNTIRDDRQAIANTYHVIIEEVRIGRNVVYRYKDPSFSIYHSELTADDVEKLNYVRQILEGFEGMPRFGWVDEMTARLQNAISGEGLAPIVGFSDNLDAEGRQFFTPLYTAIAHRHALEIVYKSFRQQEQVTYTFHPYYLKQYNNRWFLLGRNDGFDNLTILSLDRIISIEDSRKPFVPNTDIDFAAYFEDKIGVSSPRDGKVERVRIRVAASQWPYVRTKPLHGTQRVISESAAGTEIEIEVLLNYELEQQILSFGEHMTVLAPEDFRLRIQNRISHSLKNYMP